MINENPFETLKQKNSSLNSEFTPKLSSRFYAFIIDNLCVYQPITYFLTSPLIAYVKKSSFYEDGLSSAYYIQLIVIAYFFVAILISSILTHIYGATPGQRLFSLKVESTYKNKISLWDSFVRSLSFYIQALVLFIPSLSLLSRPTGLHDRISETKLKSLVASSFKPFIRQKTLKVMYSSVFIFIMLSFANFIFELSINNYDKNSVVKNSCEPVENLNLHKAVKVWDDKKAPSLIYMLNKNKRISNACFRDYLNEYISVNSKSPESYFYLWLNETSSIVKNSYQKTICKTNNAYCDLILSDVITNLPQKHFSELKPIQMATLIKYINDNEDLLRWDEVIEIHKTTSILSWLPNLRDKIYYLLSIDIKPVNYKLLISKDFIKDKTSEDTYAEATADACYVNLIKSCDYKSKHCSDFIDNSSKKYELSFYDQVNLGFMTYCNENFKPQLRGWDKEKYLSLFMDRIKNSEISSLKTVLEASYSHPRLKMASLYILLNEGVDINNLDQLLGKYNLNRPPSKAGRLPASVNKTRGD
ncbi:MAG: RDD family protein [Bdellovibrionales bacterium]|nr:RDD family protein [Bdellovibrionales bacterium]